MSEDKPATKEDVERVLVEMGEHLSFVTAPLITSKFMRNPDLAKKLEAMLVSALSHPDIGEEPQELVREIKKRQILLRAVRAFVDVFMQASQAEMAQAEQRWKVSRTDSEA